ncbi:hypothetical protein [Demequina muriae]|uniref:Uncharacterized protein n=1 Tax=Demequina muriae TaxID=3051664 RepID=A0ABT8GG14_9MICO|nr:hypothetical protein [Demequina sp. EGI L300058]MDN4480367.1 hypothetical protein [Demequina sp. EGI L300058]
MTDRELRRQAIRTWLTARPPRWVLIATTPFGVVLIACIVWAALTLENPPAWIPSVAVPLTIIVWLLLIAGWTDTYRRIVRDLRHNQGRVGNT